MTQETLRDTYALVNNLQYRTRQACSLLGVSDVTLRAHTEASGIEVPRATTGVAVRLYDTNSLFSLTAWRRASGLVKVPKTDGRPVIITVDVVKGGTGKTTTAVETAVLLQFMGLRVLTIDLDVQASLTQCFGYEDDILPEEAEQYGLTPKALVEKTFASVVTPFVDQKRNRRPMPDMSDLIKKPFGEFGPHVIPADTFLADLELEIANSTGPRELIFRSLFELSLAGGIPGFDLGGYDVVIMDCPPNVSLTSAAALAAADMVIAPVRMDSFAIKGLRRLISEIENLEAAYKVKPELVILPTHYAPHFARIGRMQKNVSRYSDALSPHVISMSEEFPKSIENYLPLALQRPTSSACKEYQVFAEYIHGKVLQIAASKAKKVKP